MIRISQNFVTDNFSPDNLPAAYCKNGDIVLFETRDCYDNRLQIDGSVFGPEKALINPSTGPLYVDEAEPGDVLKVEILHIRWNTTGMMQTSTSGGVFHGLLNESKVRQFEIYDDTIRFNDRLHFRIKPMIGVIGTAPARDAVITLTNGSHGGNMDCKQIVMGSIVYLPVNVPGALLSIGDLHALMGDGEVVNCGMEIGGEVTVRVSVIKNFSMPTPALISCGRFFTIQSADTLEHASYKASRAMLRFLQRVTDMDVSDSAMLLSLKGNLSICQIVNPQVTVCMGIEQEILDAYEVKLP